MKYILLSLLTFTLFSCTDQKMKYPETKKIETTENFHGTSIKENYRWLENDTAADTKEWVTAENKVTFDKAHKITHPIDKHKRGGKHQQEQDNF